MSLFILQNLKDFIDNPMGKGSMAIPNRQLIKDDLNKRYNKLVKGKKIVTNIYRDGDEYYLHLLIPSESERENTYDVVLHFTMGEEDFKFDNFLNRYYVKFFSNCPSFTFTYAFAYNEYGLLIESLANKYKEEVMDDRPVTRNPAEVISYEKSIYFACHHVFSNKKYMNKLFLNSMAKPYNEDEFNKKIRTEDKILVEYKKEANKVKEKKEKEAKKEQDNVKDKVTKAITGITNKDKVASRKMDKKQATVNYIKPKKKITATRSTRKKT